MGKDLFEEFPLARERYGQAGDILGFNLAKVSLEGPGEKLMQTRFTQPAIYVHSYIVYELLSQAGILPDMVAGHSLGEYSALAAGGAVSYEQGLNLVKLRGELMQKAGDSMPGAMAAIIGLEDSDVESICADAARAGIVGIANYNCPGQTVISGSVEGVDKAVELAGKAGAKRAIKLNVSGAFHSPLMESAIGQFKQALNETDFRTPKVPVYFNVTAQPVSTTVEIRDLLSRQLLSPVQWTATIRNMIKDGGSEFLEIGPGNVLSGLLRRIEKAVPGISVGTSQQVGELIQGK